MHKLRPFFDKYGAILTGGSFLLLYFTNVFVPTTGWLIWLKIPISLIVGFAAGILAFKWVMWKDRWRLERELRNIDKEYAEGLEKILRAGTRPNKFLTPQPDQLYGKFTKR